jgi:hypothetical protein
MSWTAWQSSKAVSRTKHQEIPKPTAAFRWTRPCAAVAHGVGDPRDLRRLRKIDRRQYSLCCQAGRHGRVAGTARALRDPHRLGESGSHLLYHRLLQERPISRTRLSPRPLPPEEESLGKSEWSGMSGAPVVAAGLLLGVVVEHAPRQGPSAFTAVPLTALEHDPAHSEWGPGMADPAAWWSLLGVAGLHELKRLPSAPERTPPAYWATLRAEFAPALHRPHLRTRRLRVRSRRALARRFPGSAARGRALDRPCLTAQSSARRSNRSDRRSPQW